MPSRHVTRKRVETSQRADCPDSLLAVRSHRPEFAFANQARALAAISISRLPTAFVVDSHSLPCS